MKRRAWIPGDRRMMALTSLRLVEAALCLNCDAVFLIRCGRCPACAGQGWMPLATFLSRPRAARP